MSVNLEVAGGGVKSCDLSGDGTLFDRWSANACIVLRQDIAHYLGEHAAASGKVRIDFAIGGPGTAVLNKPDPGGRLVAARHRTFEIGQDGSIRDCRLTLDQGFGPSKYERRHPCGYFMSILSLKRPRKKAPRSGDFEIRVFLEEG